MIYALKRLFTSHTSYEINKNISTRECGNAVKNGYTCSHIRPLAVRPLNHPESVPNPWGFFVFIRLTKAPPHPAGE